MQLQTIPFHNLLQAEALRFLEQFIRVVRAGGNLSAALSETLTELEARHAEAMAAFRQATGASQSSRLQQLERERDALLSGLGKVVDGLREDPDAACRTAAQKLFDNLKLYGGASAIVRQTVKAETTSINSVLRDWSGKPELAEAVRSLDLSRWTDRLKSLNDEYDTLSVARSQERASQDAAIDYTVKDKLTEARPLYEEAILLLNAGAASTRRQGQDSSAWLTTIGAANAVSEEFAALLASRTTRAAAQTPRSNV